MKNSWTFGLEILFCFVFFYSEIKNLKVYGKSETQLETKKMDVKVQR